VSVEALAVVLHHSRATGVDKLVLLGIANHAGDGGAWPTIDTLARYANATERTVQRALAKLVRAGELAVDRQAGGTANLHPYLRPNRYDVLLACPAQCDRTMNHRMRSYPLAQPLPGMPSAMSGSDPVTRLSPGDTGVTPPGDTGVTQTSTTNPLPTSVSKVTQGETCSVCSRSLFACRQAAKASGDDHAFTPTRHNERGAS
jgi:hypothetical protein